MLFNKLTYELKILLGRIVNAQRILEVAKEFF